MLLHIIYSKARQYAKTPDPLGLLRSRRERPTSSSAAEQSDELASPAR